MIVQADISTKQRCPVHDTQMEFAPVGSRPCWTCSLCEIDYYVSDLIKERTMMNPDFEIDS